MTELALPWPNDPAFSARVLAWLETGSAPAAPTAADLLWREGQQRLAALAPAWYRVPRGERLFAVRDVRWREGWAAVDAAWACTDRVALLAAFALLLRFVQETADDCA